MKKIISSLTVLSILLNLTFALAQIPNSGFENWTTTMGIEDPNQPWSTDNAYANQFSGTSAVTKSTDMHSGSYAMKLATVDGNPYDLPGVAACGAINVSLGTSINITYSKGFPWTTRSANFIGWYKYTPGNLADSGTFIAILFKRVGSVRDTVAIAYHNHGAVTSYSQYTDQFNYLSGSLTPDSAVVAFVSSKNIMASALGTELYIDDIDFSGTVPTNSVNEVTPTVSSVVVYPNPANQMVGFTLKNITNPDVLNIYDLLGKKIKSISVDGSTINVSTDGMENGLYFYQVADRNNAILSTGKFSVKK